MKHIKYIKISEALEGSIRAGEYSVKLPTVRTLSKQFDVSTRTMGKALDILEKKKLIIPNGPKGIFIADQTCNETGSLCR